MEGLPGRCGRKSWERRRVQKGGSRFGECGKEWEVRTDRDIHTSSTSKECFNKSLVLNKTTLGGRGKCSTVTLLAAKMSR